MIVTCYPLSMLSHRRSEVKYRKHEMTCSGNSNRAIVGKALCSIGHDFAIRWSVDITQAQRPLKVDIIELVQGHKWKILTSHIIPAYIPRAISIINRNDLFHLMFYPCVCKEFVSALFLKRTLCNRI